MPTQQPPDNTMWGEDIEPERLLRFSDAQIVKMHNSHSGLPRAAFREVLELRREIREMLSRPKHNK